MTDNQKCDINVTLGNDQKMKCKLKGYINMNFQGGQTVKLAEVLCVPEAVKNLLSVSRLVSKVATMGTNQYKINIKKNGVIVILDTRKGQNKSMMFYFKANSHAQEGHKALTNIPEEEKGRQRRKRRMA